MIRSLICATAWLLPAVAFCQLPEATFDKKSANKASEAFSVMTWNLEWFYDDQTGDNYSKLAKEKSAPSRDEWDWRRDAVAERIAKVQPTVLALQEVENRRVLWYLSRALTRNHQQTYREHGVEGRDFFTEQDVGLLIRRPVEVLSVTAASLPNRLRSTNRFGNVSKHLITVLEFSQDDVTERVVIVNVHLRSRPEGEPQRILQARTIQHWIAQATSVGDNIIVLGDFNTEETGDSTRPASELGVVSGRETPETDDDLVDLNLKLEKNARQTHRLDGRQFDRIFCSQSLLEDDPSKPDLVFSGITVLPELAIQGEPDPLEQHWEGYWQIPQSERDLSDHFPVLATFEMR